MDVEKEDLLTEPKPVHQIAPTSILRTLISLALFIAVDYWIFKSWTAVIILVTVIFIHELGHFIAMKKFGYKGINMTFVPFMGAFVSGQATHFSKYKKIVMLFAGPLPGILIGMLLLLLYHQHSTGLYLNAALAFLLLNVFNLIPVSPLDGGQIIETLFFHGNLVIQIAFLLFSLLIVLYFLYISKSWVLILIAWIIARRILSIQLVYKVRKALDENNISYDCSYDELTDEHYAQIRDVLITQSSSLKKRFTPGEASKKEGELIPYFEKTLQPYYYEQLTKTQTIVFVVVYLLAIILPVFQWTYLNIAI